MNSIKTYVEGKSLKVFFIISYQGKRFQVYTGITSTVKFSGMIFPKSVPNARAKTAMLARLFASVEEYIYMNGELPVARMKDAPVQVYQSGPLVAVLETAGTSG